MKTHSHRALYPFALIVSLSLGFTACGGGGGASPSVSQVQAKTLRYGQTATIQVAGKYLRSDMTAITGPTCTDPSFNAKDSTTDLAILNCKVNKTGPVPVTIKDAGGDVLFSSTLTVPQPQVTFITSEGTVVLELYPDVVPATVDNFLLYVNNGFYIKTLFHRVISGFVVQGGGYITGPVRKDGQAAPITLESNKGLSNSRGTVAMARTSDPNSATSEFYINVADNLFLDYASPAAPGYAVFGKVVSDMAVVDTIATKPTGVAGGMPNVPLADVSVVIAAQTR
jgi:cyclophilin family peptidyl-prolyl cis-trans isomerase